MFVDISQDSSLLFERLKRVTSAAAIVTYVRSTMAHAKISIDASEAKDMPGVLAVLLAEEDRKSVV